MTRSNNWHHSHHSHSNHSSHHSNHHSSHHHNNSRRGSSGSSHSSSHGGEKEIPTRDELWKGSVEKHVGDNSIVQLTGMGKAPYVVYARVIAADENTGTGLPQVTIGTVVDTMVTESMQNLATAILEKKQHVDFDKYPSAVELLKLGAVWLLNETEWLQSKNHNAHAQRLHLESEAETIPNWVDMTLRVHYVPDRFFAAHEMDWSKYCRGLLIGHTVEAKINNETPHVPVATGMCPDAKDGVIVYEDAELGFAVLHKPGAVPVHATISNHAEDAVSMFKAALVERHKDDDTKVFASVPQGLCWTLDTETCGLITVATKSQFLGYMTHSKQTFARKFKCLVCVEDSESLDRLEKFQKNRTVITHHLDQKSPAPKRFVRNKPAHTKGDWVECQMKIVQVGDNQFRAACVRSVYPDSVDSSLAHRLWGPDSATPAEDLGVQYVMEIVVELVTPARTHQIRGQLAALGCPIVGDEVYGGGQCELHSHRHVWNRMALQCSELSFVEPQYKETEEDDGKKKKELVASDRPCVFRIHQTWWGEYLAQYELYHQSV